MKKTIVLLISISIIYVSDVTAYPVEYNITGLGSYIHWDNADIEQPRVNDVELTGRMVIESEPLSNTYSPHIGPYGWGKIEYGLDMFLNVGGFASIEATNKSFSVDSFNGSSHFEFGTYPEFPVYGPVTFYHDDGTPYYNGTPNSDIYPSYLEYLDLPQSVSGSIWGFTERLAHPNPEISSWVMFGDFWMERVPVTEPTSVALFGFGLVGLGFARRKKAT